MANICMPLALKLVALCELQIGLKAGTRAAISITLLPVLQDNTNLILLQSVAHLLVRA